MTYDKQTNNNGPTTYFSRPKDGHSCLHALNNAFGRSVLELSRYLQLLSNFHPNPFLKMKQAPFSDANFRPERGMPFNHNTQLFTFLLKSLSITHQVIHPLNLESFEENLESNATVGLLCVSSHGVWAARKLDRNNRRWLLLDSSRMKPVWANSAQLWDSEAQFICIPFSTLFANDVEESDANSETSSNSGSSNNNKPKVKRIKKPKTVPVIMTLSSFNLATHTNWSESDDDFSRTPSFTSESSMADDQSAHWASVSLPRPNRFVVLYHLPS